MVEEVQSRGRDTRVWGEQNPLALLFSLVVGCWTDVWFCLIFHACFYEVGMAERHSRQVALGARLSPPAMWHMCFHLEWVWVG